MAQTQLHNNPGNTEFAGKEHEAHEAYKQVHNNYISFLKQKAKVSWLLNGDENTHVFHQILKARRIHNRINAIQNEHREWISGTQEVQNAFVQYFSDIMGQTAPSRCSVKQENVDLGAKVTEKPSRASEVVFTEEEVKNAVFSIPGDKAPSIDGFRSSFYKTT